MNEVIETIPKILVDCLAQLLPQIDPLDALKLRNSLLAKSISEKNYHGSISADQILPTISATKNKLNIPDDSNEIAKTVKKLHIDETKLPLPVTELQKIILNLYKQKDESISDYTFLKDHTELCISRSKSRQLLLSQSIK
jgi:hypothetical protein